MKMMKNNPMPPTGAHFRIKSSRLMFRAALRYLADSDRREVDRVDMPDSLASKVGLESDVTAIHPVQRNPSQ
jgi:hypothetical protein